jgi:uncharacterized protein (DUF2164 family)
MMASKKIAEVLKGIITEYASPYEMNEHLYNAFVRDSEATLEELRQADVEEVWELVSPVLKDLIARYIVAATENLEEI